MSNIGYVKVEPSDECQDLAALANITFTPESMYEIQVIGEVMLCESANQPTEGGFFIKSGTSVVYEAGSDTLWVKNLRNFESAIVNIAD